MAILGSMPKALEVTAEDTAISASCSAVGFGLMAQSPNTETRFSRHMKNTEETMDTPGTVLMNCRAGRMVCWVVCTAPETMPSACPL